MHGSRMSQPADSAHRCTDVQPAMSHPADSVQRLHGQHDEPASSKKSAEPMLCVTMLTAALWLLHAFEMLISTHPSSS
eukprot:scaffold34442_cov19-Tisochrysis_lutea.AAC.5